MTDLSRESLEQWRSELAPDLERGVVATGMSEDNSTELFDVDGASETMFEASEALLALIDAHIAMTEALTRIAAPRNCGCMPVCRCDEPESLMIELEGIRDIALAALNPKEPKNG